MSAQTISQVSRNFGISTRMLRYYEQEGLLESFRQEGYAYRMYDEKAVSRLRQIYILRKLRLPLKQIKSILQKPDTVTAIEIFEKNIAELNGEIGALTTIKNILERFVKELEKAADVQLASLFSQNDAILSAIEPLSMISINFREDQSMDQPLQKAEEQLSKLKDVRIVYLPPATVASAHHIGDEPEHYTSGMMAAFVREAGLPKCKPDVRSFGFNHPNPVDETNYHGYEVWVTIPEDMEVPAPLTKKHFPGGLYAAHMIPIGNFNEWEWLFDWVGRSDTYEFAGDMQDSEHMHGLLEEHLNYYNHIHLENVEPENLQLDLLLPIREKK